MKKKTKSPELSMSSQFQFPTSHRKPFDRLVSKIPQKALQKQAQTSTITNLFKKFITTIWLKVSHLLKNQDLK